LQQIKPSFNVSQKEINLNQGLIKRTHSKYLFYSHRKYSLVILMHQGKDAVNKIPEVKILDIVQHVWLVLTKTAKKLSSTKPSSLSGFCDWIIKYYIFSSKLPVNSRKSIQLVLSVIALLGVQENLKFKNCQKETIYKLHGK